MESASENVGVTGPPVAEPVSQPDAHAPSYEVEGRFRMKARAYPFTTFCEGLQDIEKGFHYFDRLYRRNFDALLPESRDANVLVMSCGIGYFVKYLNESGFGNVVGIDSDPAKVVYGKSLGLNVEHENLFDFLEDTKQRFDMIVAEQEINHLTKDEVVVFLTRARRALVADGRLVVNSANYSNPITSADHLGLNFDHFTAFTEGGLEQAFAYCGFRDVRCLALDNYVFYGNPLNWVAKGITGLQGLWWKFLFRLYGKKGKLFTKRIIAVATRDAAAAEDRQ